MDTNFNRLTGLAMALGLGLGTLWGCVGSGAPAGSGASSSDAAAVDASASPGDVAGDGLGDDAAQADGAAQIDGHSPSDTTSASSDTQAAADAGSAPLCSEVATSGKPMALEALATASSVLDHTGAAVDVASLKGKWTVMWFYPAAQTAG